MLALVGDLHNLLSTDTSQPEAALPYVANTKKRRLRLLHYLQQTCQGSQSSLKGFKSTP